MKLHIIKQFVNFAEQKDSDYLQETSDTLENLIELDRLSENEIDVIGELLSNLSASMEVLKMMKEGKSKTEAINTFMKRVVGSVDK
jgi:hypothetical protein